MNRIRNAYFLWLIDRVRIPEVDADVYCCLLEYLFDRDYTWCLELDSNMASHGLNLRYEFDPSMDLGIKNCSVLEMMIGLSWSWEHEITYDYFIGDRTGLWFWTMIDNLGLSEYDDGRFDVDCVGSIIDVWLERSFDYDGKGSPFPLKNATRDQRTLITWLQVNDFVMENMEF